MRLIFKHTMQYLAGAMPKCVLDIGCGSGVYSAELARQRIAVTGLDSCKEMIDATKSLLAQNGLSGQVQTVIVGTISIGQRKTDRSMILPLPISPGGRNRE